MSSPKRLVPLSVLVALRLALTLGCGATAPIGTVEKDMEEKAALEPEVQQDATTDGAAPESEEPVDATRNSS
ncbi:MAG: hypothetical protein Q4A07_01905 [Coriobacteriales bacterium]|nr:hypothetical protein [Coriobacteriales bacterium]